MTMKQSNPMPAGTVRPSPSSGTPPCATRLPRWAEDKIERLQEENRRLKERLAEMETITLHFPSGVGKSEHLLKLMTNTVQHSPAQGHSDTSLNRDLQHFTRVRAVESKDDEG